VKVRLTPLGKLFLLLMALFYLASMTSQSGLLLLFIGLFSAAFMVNFVVCRRTVGAVEVQAPHEAMIEAGEKLKEPWKIVNHRQIPAQLLEVHSPAGRLLRIAQISSNGFVAKVPPLIFTKRGIYQNAAITVSSIAPFGLWRATKSMGLTGRTVVIPKLYDVDSPPAASLDRMPGGKLSGGQRVTSGMSFAGVREWQAGDSFRNIHWKSTAAQGKLMVKLFDEELSGRIAIFLKLGRDEEVVVENSIRAAGSLALAALEEGHQVEFLDSGSSEPLLLAPFSDTQDLLLRLAGVVPSDETLVSEEIVRRIMSKAAICAVFPKLTQSDLGLIEEFAQNGRKVVVVVPRGTQVPRDTPARVLWFTGDGIETNPGK
jgi:uncharacterized protein (DUF58 family)